MNDVAKLMFTITYLLSSLLKQRVSIGPVVVYYKNEFRLWCNMQYEKLCYDKISSSEIASPYLQLLHCSEDCEPFINFLFAKG